MGYVTTAYKIKPGQPPSDAQAGLLRRLTKELGRDAQTAEDALANLDRAGVSAVIDQLFAAQRAAQGPRREGPPTTKEGYYQNEAGDVYVVKANKTNGHTSAKKLWFKEAENGGRLPRWTYERGAVYRLEGMVPLTVDEMTRLSHFCGRCILCGRALEDKNSVTRGIGPVCIKKLAA